MKIKCSQCKQTSILDEQLLPSDVMEFECPKCHEMVKIEIEENSKGEISFKSYPTIKPVQESAKGKKDQTWYFVLGFLILTLMVLFIILIKSA